MLKPKIQLKLERIARLRLFSGLKDKSICDLLQISQSNFSQIIAMVEYEEIEKRLAAGDIQELDIALAGKTKELRDAFAPLVPAAMRALQDAVLQRRDLKTAVSAATQILDRDPQGSFANATKQQGPAAFLPQSVLANAAAAAKSVTGPVVVSAPDKNMN